MSYYAITHAFVLRLVLSGFAAGAIGASLLWVAVVVSFETAIRVELATTRVELHRIRAEKCPTPLTVHERVMKWIERDGEVKCQRFWATSVLESPQ